MTKKHIIKKTEYSKKTLSELKTPGTEVVRPHIRKVSKALKDARKKNLVPPFTKKTAKKVKHQASLDIKSQELTPIASSSTLEKLEKLMIRDLWWIKAEFRPSGKNTWDVYNAKGKSEHHIVKLEKSRYKLYHRK